MLAVLFRLVLLAIGMGAIEIGLGDALATGSPVGWALVLLVGLPLGVAGSAGFMAPLLGRPKQKGPRMRKSVSIAATLALALSIGVVTVAMAHAGSGEAKIEVEPGSVTAGQTVILAGSGLEPDNDRVLVLAGGGLTVEFGTVKTDAEGMFSKELTIPDHLPSGNYELQAIGDETLTTPLTVTAAAGGAAASPAANDAQETVVARERTPIELALILVLVVVAAAVGGLLVWRAERFRGAPAA